jgi:hypothetical protein
MRSVERTSRAPHFLANYIRPNLALLLRTGFRSIRRSEIHMNTKVDIDGLNRRQRCMSCLSRIVMAVSRLLRIGVGQIHTKE